MDVKAGDKKPKFNNYQERKAYEDELAKKDVVKKGLLGGGLKDMFGKKDGKEKSPEKETKGMGILGGFA